jgi:Flp pilus assembly protein TadD
MQTGSKHQSGIDQFLDGAYDDAVQLLSEALLENENCELWNDWATAQAAAGHMEEAIKGYQRALQLNVNHCQSAANLGILLYEEGKITQAVPLLEKSLRGLDEKQRDTILQLLEQSRQQSVVINKRATGS